MGKRLWTLLKDMQPFDKWPAAPHSWKHSFLGKELKKIYLDYESDIYIYKNKYAVRPGEFDSKRSTTNYLFDAGCHNFLVSESLWRRLIDDHSRLTRSLLDDVWFRENSLTRKAKKGGIIVNIIIYWVIVVDPASYNSQVNGMYTFHSTRWLPLTLCATWA